MIKLDETGVIKVKLIVRNYLSSKPEVRLPDACVLLVSVCLGADRPRGGSGGKHSR